MAIKNKDGSVYKLNSPNPFMEKQEIWDMKDVKLHNFQFKRIVLEPATSFSTPAETEEPEPEIEKIAIHAQAKKTEEIIPEMPEELPEPKKPTTASEVVLDSIHCLPGTIRYDYDDLYEEDRTTVEYGKKFILKAKIVDQTDLRITLWTADEPPGEGSILYPIKERRWWRVTQTAEAPRGYWCRAVPSSIQPSFD